MLATRWLAAHFSVPRVPAYRIMTKAIILLLAIVFFKAKIIDGHREAHRIKPYNSVFDVSVPADLACSPLCDPIELMKRVGKAPKT